MPITTWPEPVVSSETINTTNNYASDTLLKNPNNLDKTMIYKLQGEGPGIYARYTIGNHVYRHNVSEFWSLINSLPYDDSFVTQPITEDSLQTILNTTGSGKFYGLITANIGSSATHYVKITIDGTEYTITLDPTAYSRTIIGLNLTHAAPETVYASGNSTCIAGYDDYGWYKNAGWILSPSTFGYDTKFIIYDTSLKIEYYVSDIDSGTYDGYFYTSYIENIFV